MSTRVTRLVLAGGGHAQLSVLTALARNRPTRTEVVLIAPGPFQTYSGMLPGWMAGHYALDACRIDLRPLAHAAGARLITARVVGLDADRRRLHLSNGTELVYNLLSLDVGSETELSTLVAAGPRLLPIRPIDDFITGWEATVAAATRQPELRVAVVGGGAAGVELAFAAQHRLAPFTGEHPVTLVVPENGLLPGHAPSVARRVQRLLAQRDIVLRHGRASSDADGLVFADGAHLHADCILAATGARSPVWLLGSGLRLDAAGFVSVNGDHRSVSHFDVFAGGDVCHRVDRDMARSGVHAVHAGPVLAHNVLATLAGRAMAAYTPRKKSLYLLATRPGHAVVSWGRWSREGELAWRWKDWIDRRFIRKYSGPQVGGGTVKHIEEHGRASG